jgi:hypothetical protein
MSMTGFFLRYGWAIGLREWLRWSRIRPEVRVRTTAVVGAVIAPFVVFVLPVGRVYWLITGRRLPGPLRLLATSPRIFVNPNPFPDSRPPEIRQLLERPEFKWEPGPGDIPRWFGAWTRVTQVLFWQMPTGLDRPRKWENGARAATETVPSDSSSSALPGR